MYFTPEQEEFRKVVRDFVDTEINPNVDKWEEEIVPLHDLFKKMGDLGLLGVRYDKKWGGLGLDNWSDLAFLEELGHVKCWGVPIAIMVQTHMATPALHNFASEYLKETYLLPALKGDMVAAVGVSEPESGSDVAGLRTTAKRDGYSWVVNGSKMFITNAVQADFITLLARTSDKPGYHSFSLFVVPTDAPGFRIGRKLNKLGLRSSDMALLFFKDMRIPAENLIGEAGEGFIYQMRQFQDERFSTLPPTYVFCRDVIDMTVSYLKHRKTFGQPLISRQVLRHRLVDWIALVESLRHLTYHIVRMKDAGQDPTREISIGKLMAGRMAREITDGCLQMYGGRGYIHESLIARFFRDARLLSIGAGTDEIMAEIVAKREGF